MDNVNMKVYVVTSGSYSDYAICAIFSTKELAQSYIALYGERNLNFNDIEEYPIDFVGVLDTIKSGRKSYDVFIQQDGSIDECRIMTYPDSDMDFYITAQYYFYDKNRAHIECVANDEQHAIKIANEIRTELIALNRWGKNKDDF